MISITSPFLSSVRNVGIAKALEVYPKEPWAVNAIVDESTRNVQVQATLPNPRGHLRPGMFVDVRLATGGTRGLLAVPTSAINYAPYGNSVFVVGDVKGPDGKTFKGAKQQFVVLGGQRGDQVAVLKGLNDGDEVVSSGVFKLRSGAAVIVNNSVTPGNNADPKPEEN